MDELPIKEYINKNYVSKDKIRELLAELEDMSISQDIYFEDIQGMITNLLNE